MTWFAAFFVFALWAFWPSYYSRASEVSEWRVHAHGVVMTLWCVMLIAQAAYIRGANVRTHRRLGVASYVLAPLVLAATIELVHYRLAGGGTLPDIGLYQVALMVNGAVAFAVLYGLAIVFRRDHAAHGRFMLCTVFPLFTPATDRWISRNWPSLISLVPSLNGVPLVQILGFALADVLLIALVIWDWRGRRRIGAFAVSLAVIAAYHASVLTFYRFEFWRTFSDWFRGLPIS